MDQLEIRVSNLEQKNEDLARENKFLQKQNDLLIAQNRLLNQSLESKSAPAATVAAPTPKSKSAPAATVAAPTAKSESAAAGAASPTTSVESAALISGPLQQGQDGVARVASLLTLSLLSWAGFQVALATTGANMLICSNSSQRPSSEASSRSLRLARRPPPLLWWGPRQRSWSPAKIGQRQR